MSWMQSLYQTYEEGMKLDIADDSKPMPISHSMQNAHINIVLDSSGNFLRAKVLNKFRIVLPATEDSASRAGSKPPPHPLNDKLQYVAADYPVFGGKKPSFFKEYRNLLASWCNSDYSHEVIRIVLEYVEKKQVVKDLVNAKILFVDNNQNLLTPSSLDEVQNELEIEIFKSIPKDSKTKCFDQGAALVCWSVEIPGRSISDTWKDKELMEKWKAFDAEKSSVSGLCVVTGEECSIALNHPSKILKSASGAKLISSNDDAGFTFRGKFTDTKSSMKKKGLQAGNVGFETSQKIHNALRWLVERQGYQNGEQAIVAWAVSGQQIPSPLVATTEFDLDNFDEIDDSKQDSRDATKSVIDHSTDVGQSFAAKLTSYMRGYREKLSDTDQISIMAIDSATPGRMGITYYRETLPQEYIDRITQWHADMAWPQRVVIEIPQTKGKPKAKVAWLLSAPSPYAMLQVVYGDVIKSNDSLKKNFYERLVPCVLEGRAIPFDLVKLSMARASNPAAQEYWEWERALGVACSLIRGFYLRHPRKKQRKEFAMSLDTSNTSRDYLYGRLLALAERLEEVALRAANVNRPTTANRLMQRFADRPYETWLTIYKQLDPYIRQMKSSRPGFLTNINKELDTVMDLFDHDQFISPKALTGEFLLGFHCQRLTLNQKPETKIDTKLEITEEQGA